MKFKIRDIIEGIWIINWTTYTYHININVYRDVYNTHIHDIYVTLYISIYINMYISDIPPG